MAGDLTSSQVCHTAMLRGPVQGAIWTFLLYKPDATRSSRLMTGRTESVALATVHVLVTTGEFDMMRQDVAPPYGHALPAWS